MAAALAAVCVSLLVMSWVAPDDSDRITFQVHRALESAGGWIDTEDETARLQFSEGTSIALHPHTRLRVSETRADGATVSIEQGRATARVEHEKSPRNWRFEAGPYVVRVTGTEFDISWDTTEGVLELSMHSGSVIVNGPNLSRNQSVQAGEFLRIQVGSPVSSSSKSLHPAEFADPKSGQGSPSPDPDPRRGMDPVSVKSDPADGREAAEDPSSNTSGIRSAAEALEGVRETSTDWRRALASGEQARAMTIIQAEGGKTALSHAGPDELWQIADAARLANDPRLAVDALMLLRQKFGARGESAYLAGKIFVDQLGSPREAVKWFKTYLDESPGGSLTEEALGRLVVLQGDTQEGRASAKEYLRRYPRGAYAEFSRTLTSPSDR